MTARLLSLLALAVLFSSAARAEEVRVAKAAPVSRAAQAGAFPAIAQKLEQKSNVQRYRAFKDIYDPREPTRFVAPTFVQRMKLYEEALAASARRSDRELGKILGRWGRYYGPSAGYGGALHGVTWPFFSFSQTLGAFTASSIIVHSTAPAAWPRPFEPEPGLRARLLAFLRSNRTADGMPLSYAVPPGFWDTYKPYMNLVDTVLERLLLSNGLSIYDGALWQIALALGGDAADWPKIAGHTQRLASGSSGELKDIRAFGPDYLYGEERKEMTAQDAYFFRIIADRYMQEDPLLGSQPIPGFPNFEMPHHEDWKPITGEQAWAAIIGPLQTAYLKGGGTISQTSPEWKLALSILPAVEAMRSRIGAIYHVPAGTRGKYPNEISNENNFSMYGALKILKTAAGDSDPALTGRIDRLLAGLEEYFRRYAFDPAAGIFYQGGFLDEEGFHASQIFAVDCQTWAILALGPEWIDRAFGADTAARLWENTRYRAEYLDPDGRFRGIGFSDGHGIYSTEWTCGAIAAVRRLRDHYRQSHTERAKRLAADVALMREGLETFRVAVAPGTDAYLYSNKRYFIQFGWWANPVPSLASTAWVLMIDQGFDPFILGGGPLFGKKPDGIPDA